MVGIIRGVAIRKIIVGITNTAIMLTSLRHLKALAVLAVLLLRLKRRNLLGL